MDRDRVSDLGAFYVERSRLWIDKWVDDGAARQIGARADLSTEGIFRENVEDLTGPDPEYGLVSAKGPRVLIRGRNESGSSTVWDDLTAFRTRASLPGSDSITEVTPTVMGPGPGRDFELAGTVR